MPEPELHHPQQPTLPLEMFLDQAAASPGGISSTPIEQVGQTRTCRPSAVWETLAQMERERARSSWTRTMREVTDERSDR